MDKDLKNLLLHFDDANEWYASKHFDYYKEMERVKNIKKLIENKTGYKFEIDEYVQDASFFTELFILEKSQKEAKENGEGYALSYELAIRFSSFGNLVTIIMNPNDGETKYNTVSLINILKDNGYTYIVAENLNEPYDGKNKVLVGEYTWWGRFFDYL